MVSPPSLIDALPILGEPLAVELANTAYGRGDEAIDFLGSPDLIDAWMAGAAPGLSPTRPFRGRDADALRELRDATGALVGATVDRRPLPPGAIDVVNRHAARAPASWQLRLGRDGAACVQVERSDLGPAGTLGLLAHHAIVLLGGDDAPRLRRCARPNCTMTFVQRHGRRRWCHDSCGHRSRQAAYYRRRHAREDGP